MTSTLNWLLGESSVVVYVEDPKIVGTAFGVTSVARLSLVTGDSSTDSGDELGVALVHALVSSTIVISKRRLNFITGLCSGLFVEQAD